MTKYNTNLASEYYVLATLYRLGFDAYITLGNKKSIDIILHLENHKQITIDVKGLQGTTMYPLDNIDEFASKPNHFIVFLSFRNKMTDTEEVPDIYVVPHDDIKNKNLMYNAPSGRKGIRLATLRNSKDLYKSKWDLLNQ